MAQEVANEANLRRYLVLKQWISIRISFQFMSR